MFRQFKAQGNLEMLEEVTVLLITISSKHHNEKRPAVQGIKLAMDKFHEEIGGIMLELTGLIRSYDFLIDIATSVKDPSINYSELLSQKIDHL